MSWIASLQLRLAALATEPALALLAQQALAVLGGGGTAIALKRGEQIVCCARAGALAPPLGTVINTRSGLANECLRTGEIVLCEDTEADVRVDPCVSRESGIRSVVVSPIHADNEVVGVFSAFAPHAAAFGDREAGLLRLLAGFVPSRIVVEPAPWRTPEPSAAIPPAPPNQPAASVDDQAPAAPTPAISSSAPSAPSSPRQWASSAKVSTCLDRIRQDPALRVLGRAKAYLTIEALYDGTDRSQAVMLCQRLMFERAAEIDITL